MENLEKVEKIREKTGVSYEDARNALNASNYDVLDAIIYLENIGKVKAPSVSSYTTGNELLKNSERFETAQVEYQESCRRITFGEAVDKFFNWCGRILKKSWDIKIEVSKGGQKQGAMPLLILILLMLCAFWVIIPLMVVGLFFDFKYTFIGVDKVTVDLNKMCDKASDACTNIKNEMKSGKENE